MVPKSLIDKEKGVSSSSSSSGIRLPSSTTPLSGNETQAPDPRWPSKCRWSASPKPPSTASIAKLSVPTATGEDSSPLEPIVSSDLPALTPSESSKDGTSTTPLLVSTTGLNVSTLSATLPDCQGAWAQPINISSDSSLNTTSQVVNGDKAVKLCSLEMWPSL
ncbi:unnamed protein product [Arabis nemorensis]|uniref:Uncharacterized protein n=1 Tax=Arabis nemorensis TaxID=586526 RepID=A0A565ANQ6_9BRAS|nr:unnamed protein product [Arabis nemorensis]